MPNTMRKANRLAEEKSPYLLQHAQNSVDWYPWRARFAKNMRAIDNKTTAYMCKGFVCEKPITEAKEVLRFLTESSTSQQKNTASF